MASLLVSQNTTTRPKSNNIFKNTSLILPLISVTLLATALCFLGKLTLTTSSLSSPQPPTVRLDSLIVSNLNVSRSTFTASFDVKFTVQNPNSVWTVALDRIEGFVTYKDNAVAISSAPGFALGPTERNAVRVRIATTGTEGDQPAVRGLVLEGIRKELRGGAGGVGLAVQMAVWGSYRVSWWGTRQRVVMNPRCDLRLSFVTGIGLGRWASKSPMLCSVPMLPE